MTKFLEEIPEDFITEFNLLAVALAYQEPDQSLLATMEKMLLQQALERCRGNQKRASECLGISPRKMNYLVRETYPDLREHCAGFLKNND